MPHHRQARALAQCPVGAGRRRPPAQHPGRDPPEEEQSARRVVLPACPRETGWGRQTAVEREGPGGRQSIASGTARDQVATAHAEAAQAKPSQHGEADRIRHDHGRDREARQPSRQGSPAPARLRSPRSGSAHMTSEMPTSPCVSHLGARPSPVRPLRRGSPAARSASVSGSIGRRPRTARWPPSRDG